MRIFILLLVSWSLVAATTRNPHWTGNVKTLTETAKITLNDTKQLTESMFGSMKQNCGDSAEVPTSDDLPAPHSDCDIDIYDHLKKGLEVSSFDYEYFLDKLWLSEYGRALLQSLLDRGVSESISKAAMKELWFTKATEEDTPFNRLFFAKDYVGEKDNKKFNSWYTYSLHEKNGTECSTSALEDSIPVLVGGNCGDIYTSFFIYPNHPFVDMIIYSLCTWVNDYDEKSLGHICQVSVPGSTKLFSLKTWIGLNTDQSKYLLHLEPSDYLVETAPDHHWTGNISTLIETANLELEDIKSMTQSMFGSLRQNCSDLNESSEVTDIPPPHSDCDMDIYDHLKKGMEDPSSFDRDYFLEKLWLSEYGRALLNSLSEKGVSESVSKAAMKELWFKKDDYEDTSFDRLFFGRDISDVDRESKHVNSWYTFSIMKENSTQCYTHINRKSLPASVFGSCGNITSNGFIYPNHPFVDVIIYSLCTWVNYYDASFHSHECIVTVPGSTKLFSLRIYIDYNTDKSRYLLLTETNDYRVPTALESDLTGDINTLIETEMSESMFGNMELR